MVSRQDAHLAYRLPETERDQLADAVIRAIPRGWLSHGDSEHIPFLLDLLAFRARRDEDFQIHPFMVLHRRDLLHNPVRSAPE